MKPDIPSHPCPAPTAAKACFSSHKRCTIERLSLSLFHSPSFFYSSLVLVLPVGKARCQPLPKAGQSALTLYANASPLAQLTHSFCAPHHHLLLHSLIYFFHLLLCNLLSLTLFPFPVLHIVVALQPPLPLLFAVSPSHFCQLPVLSLSIVIHFLASLSTLPCSFQRGTPSSFFFSLAQLDSRRLKLVQSFLGQRQTGKGRNSLYPSLSSSIFFTLSHIHTQPLLPQCLKGKPSSL